MTDKKITAVLLVFMLAAIFCLLAVSSGFVNPVFMSLLNIITGIAVTGYWLRRYLLHRHRVEQREIVFICAELIGMALSLFFIFKLFHAPALLAAQYLILSLHLLAASGLLAFFLLFKMKKLF
jgi:hypothetical protein